MCPGYAFLAASRAVSLTWRTLLATLLTFWPALSARSAASVTLDAIFCVSRRTVPPRLGTGIDLAAFDSMLPFLFGSETPFVALDSMLPFRFGSGTPMTLGRLRDRWVMIAVAASPAAAAPPASNPVLALEAALPTVSAAFFAPLVTVSVTAPTRLWLADDALLVARLACDFPFDDAFDAVFLAGDFAAADFELPFFDAVRDFVVLRLVVLFCFVWAIMTLLSMESFRGAAYPGRKAVKPLGKGVQLFVRLVVAQDLVNEDSCCKAC